MKRTLAAVALAASFAAGSAFAAPKHPNLAAAHKDVKEAIAKVTAAQTANEYDMEGHAAKAKDLLEQAEKEIGLAAEAATANKK